MFFFLLMNCSFGWIFSVKLTAFVFLPPQHFPTTARRRHLDDPSFRWPSQPRRCLVPWLEFVDNFRGPCNWYHFERLKVGFCCVSFAMLGERWFLLSWTDLNVCWFLLIWFIWIDVVRIHGWLMFVGRIYLDELLDIIEVMKRSHSHRSHRIHVWYIYLHLPLKEQPNVGIYTSPMDPMGMVGYMFIFHGL